MAREYASIKLSIWNDDDWRDLSPLAKLLYLSLLTSSTLSHCGVADWRPARLAATVGMTTAEVEESGAELVDSLHLVIDEASEEVLIRSFVRNDGLMKQPKMAVAMASAHAAVASKAIRGVIVHEIKRLKKDHPDLHGWGSERASDLLGLRSVDPSTYPLGKGSVKGSGKGKATPTTKGSPTPAPTPAPSNLTPSGDSASADAEREFDEFWSVYPRKRDKGHAAKAYRTARKKASAEDLLHALRRQLPELTSVKVEFIPYASRWLSGERWLDAQVVDLRPGEPFDERNLPPIQHSWMKQRPKP